MKGLMDALPLALFVLGKDKKVLEWNKGMEELTGVLRIDAVGSSYRKIKFYASASTQDEIDIFSCIKKSETETAARNIYLIDASGTMRHLYAQMRNTEGPFSVVVTLSDISVDALCKLIDLPKAEISVFHGLVGKDTLLQNMYERIRRASASAHATVMISGESGTGKELVARAIHDLSERKDKPFVAVHCSSLPETLLESELFGHVKGAFTGAIRDVAGKFESASRGTIFLDEIGDISPLIQLKLLRVIQERSVQRIGSSKEVPVDIRILTATNKDLRDLVRKGEFREDLFYRLNVFPLETVPLREHRNDIPLMCEHFIYKLNARTGRKISSIGPDAMRLLMDHCYPGNVRELENAIEHAFVLCAGNVIQAVDLPAEIRLNAGRGQDCSKTMSTRLGAVVATGNVVTDGPKKRNRVTKEQLLSALEESGGNRSDASKLLGLSRVSLWKKMKLFGIE